MKEAAMSDYRDPQLNQLTISGRLARDAELKYSQGGKPFVKSGIFVNYGYGETKRSECWNFTWFGTMAEKFAANLLKGRAVIVTGRIDMERWEGKDGDNREKPVIIANNVSLNDWPTDTAQAPPRATQSAHNTAKANGYAPEPPEDDIPF